MGTKQAAIDALNLGRQHRKEGLPLQSPYTGGSRENNTPLGDPARHKAYLNDCYHHGHHGGRDLPALAKGDPELT
jgi:hypothetical protein